MKNRANCAAADTTAAWKEAVMNLGVRRYCPYTQATNQNNRFLNQYALHSRSDVTLNLPV